MRELAQEQAPITINTYKEDIMNTDIKQAMHVEAAKSFSSAEANENERRWNDDKIDRKNQDSTNNYDKTRMKLNFEIGTDGKIHTLGYHEKSARCGLRRRMPHRRPPVLATAC